MRSNPKILAICLPVCLAAPAQAEIVWLGAGSETYCSYTYGSGAELGYISFEELQGQYSDSATATGPQGDATLSYDVAFSFDPEAGLFSASVDLGIEADPGVVPSDWECMSDTFIYFKLTETTTFEIEAETAGRNTTFFLYDGSSVDPFAVENGQSASALLTLEPGGYGFQWSCYNWGNFPYEPMRSSATIRVVPSPSPLLPLAGAILLTRRRHRAD